MRLSWLGSFLRPLACALLCGMGARLAYGALGPLLPSGRWGDGASLLAAVAFGAGLYLAALLPHGIFELAALVLAAACGVYLCRNIGRLVTNSPKKIPAVELLTDLLRVLVMVIAPLTAAAAFIESYVTPVIASFFM